MSNSAVSHGFGYRLLALILGFLLLLAASLWSGYPTTSAEASEPEPQEEMPWAEDDLETTDGYSHEVRDERTRYSRTYEQEDGDNESVLYLDPINFKNEDEDWQGIDNSLVPSDRPGYAYENKANSYTVYFPEEISENPVRIEEDGEWIEYSLDGAVGPPVAAGSTVTYSDALTEVDVAYTAQATQVEEFLTLNDPSAPQEFSFEVSTSDDASPEEEADGSVTLEDGSTGEDFTFEPAYMFDSSSEVEVNTKTVDVDVESESSVALEPSLDWINDPERVWPIVVDPTVTTMEGMSELGTTETESMPPPISDCYMYSDGTDADVCSNGHLRVGETTGAGNKYYRSLMRFNIAGTFGDNPNKVLVDAQLEARVTSDNTQGQNEPVVTIDVHAVKNNRDWTNNATWSRYRWLNGVSKKWDSFNTSTGGGGDVEPSDFEPAEEGAGQNEDVWEIWSDEAGFDRVDEAVQQWIGPGSAEGFKNQGFLLRRSPDDTSKNVVWIASSDATQYKPKLRVEWEDLFVSHEPDSFYRDKLPTNLDPDVNSQTYLDFASDDLGWEFPLIEGIDTDAGIASLMTDSSDEIWKFQFGLGYPSDEQIKEEPAVAWIMEQGFRAPDYLPEVLSEVADFDKPVTIVDRDHQFDFWASECNTLPNRILECDVDRPGFFEQESDGLMNQVDEMHAGNVLGTNDTNFRAKGVIPGAMAIRRDEIRAGLIPHVLHMFWPKPRDTCVHPLVNADGEDPGPNDPFLPLMGMRLRIKEEVNLDNKDLSYEGKVIATALQDYGAYIGDNSGGTTDKMVLKTQQDFDVPSGEGGGRYWNGIEDDGSEDITGLDRFALGGDYNPNTEQFSGLDLDDFEFVKAGYQTEYPNDPRTLNCPPS